MTSVYKHTELQQFGREYVARVRGQASECEEYWCVEVCRGVCMCVCVCVCVCRYMKYLYPYECEKLKLSTLSELQSAIDGNRREGRRPGYGYEFSPLPASMLSAAPTPHLNGPPAPLHPSLMAAAAAAASTRPASALSAKGRRSLYARSSL